ncbi:MAG: hypothetical protein V4587_10340, partial [Acidobacteriota bacterium]
MKYEIKIAVALLLLLTGLVGTGCRKKATNPFPASGQVAGWEKSGSTRTYSASDLWQYIDGGAEQYVNAGVISCVTSDYK